MLIYRIRDKGTGLYIVNPWKWTYAEGLIWNSTGQFWRRIDTVYKHLITLSTEWHWEKNGLRHYPCSKRWPGPHVTWDVPTVSKGFRPEWLEKYEIVIHDITVNGERIISGPDLFKEKTNPGI